VAFDKSVIRQYESWFASPAGLYVDEKEKELLLENMRFKRGEKVLEVGSGSGRYLEYISGLGMSVTGVEAMEELIKVSKLRSAVNDSMVIKAAPENLPFENTSFDNVFSVIAFQFSADKVKVFSEMFRVTRKKVGIGFLNRHAIANIFNAKERRRLYKDADVMSGGELKDIITEGAGGAVKKEDIKIKYSIYLPVKAAHIAPFVDDLLEKTNLPLGSFGMAVVSKEKK